MSKDRQEKKLKKSRQTESDRDTKGRYNGSSYLDTPQQAKQDNLP